MELTVDALLERRLHPTHGRARAMALAAAVALHAVAVGAAAVAGWLGAEKKPVVFAPVKLMPLAALGTPEPPPRRRTPAPPKPEERKPEPEVKKPEPKPEEKPAPPSPTAKPSRKPAPAPAPPPPEPEPAEPETRRGSARGSELGTSVFGAEVGALDNPSFTYDYYLDRMLSMIEANWTRPSATPGTQAVLHFRIRRDGRATDIEVLEPSGLEAFDLAALRAVANAAPFPPLPASYRSDSLGVNLIVR